MKRMKILRFAVIMLVSLLVLAFPLDAQAKDTKKVERGMSRAQVTEIYGKPMAMSFDETSECWSYEKSRGGLLTPYNVRITVEFDVDGKVVRCKEVILEDKKQTTSTSTTWTSNGGARLQYGNRRVGALSDGNFNILLSKVRGASFDDRKLDLIQVACMGCWLTCKQGASIISVFSFTDGKMKALKFIAPRLIDLQNTNEIYRQFTFGSDKDKAAEIIRQSQK